MPVFRSGKGNAPAWCEMTNFEIVDLQPGESRKFAIETPKEKWIVAEGECTFRVGDKTSDLDGGKQIDAVLADGAVEVSAKTKAKVIRMVGRWGDEVGGAGLFWVINSDDPKDFGDPVDYPKTTNFDRHYHDCDEYWIIYEGSGIAVSENKQYEVKPGDCVATGMGHHHDFPIVHEGPVKAVFFETTMEGRKRIGHLWNHTHGEAEPVAERV